MQNKGNGFPWIFPEQFYFSFYDPYLPCVDEYSSNMYMLGLLMMTKVTTKMIRNNASLWAIFNAITSKHSSFDLINPLSLLGFRTIIPGNMTANLSTVETFHIFIVRFLIAMV